MQFSTKKIRVNFLFGKNTKPGGGGVRGGFSKSLNFLRFFSSATFPNCDQTLTPTSYQCQDSDHTDQITQEPSRNLTTYTLMRPHSSLLIQENVKEEKRMENECLQEIF